MKAIILSLIHILVILKGLEEELASKLLTSEELQQGYFFKFNVDVVLRATFSERMEGYAKARQNGWDVYKRQTGIEEIKNNNYVLVPSRYIEFENIENAHRPYNEIVADINRIITEKNTCKLTINETIAKSLGFDIELFKQDNGTCLLYTSRCV